MLPTTSITRRQALRQTFFYSAAVALATRLSPSALGQAPAAVATPASGAHDFLMIGDFGRVDSKSKRQEAVASAMRTYAKAQGLKTDGLFLLGDNFYGAFKGGVECPRWKSGFEDMYPKSAFPGPCWAMLGNHDYDEERGEKMLAQLGYAAFKSGTRWRMPAKWYRVDWPAVNPVASFLILDSNYGGFTNKIYSLSEDERLQQLAWLESELKKPQTAPWTVCMAHHPLYSNGPHGDTAPLIRDWGALFQKYNVAAYFCGHDHDLQHLEFDGISTSFVVSGGGGAGLTKLKKEGRSVYSEAVHGFTHLTLTPEQMTVRHVDPNQKVLHVFNRSLQGKVTLPA